MTYRASGFAYEASTRDWTKLTYVNFPNEQQAKDWCKFNRDWMKGLEVERVEEVQ